MYFSSVYVKLHIHVLHSSVSKELLDMLAVSSRLPLSWCFAPGIMVFNMSMI